MAIRVRTTRKDMSGNTGIEVYESGYEHVIEANGVLNVYNGEGDRIGSYAPEKWVSVARDGDMKVEWVF